MDRNNVAGDKLYARHSFAPDEAWRRAVSLVPFALFNRSSLGWSWRKGKADPFKTLCPVPFSPVSKLEHR